MALSVEHIVHALLKRNIDHPKSQLFEMFKQIWPASTQVGKLLRSNEFRQVSHKTAEIDITWFNSKQNESAETQIACDLAICHAIRGNAHYQMTENNQLLLERMSLVLLRGVVRAFVEAIRRWPERFSDT